MIAVDVVDMNEVETVVHNDLDIYRKYKNRKITQYRQYQQNELSPLSSTHWTWKNTTAYHAKIMTEAKRWCDYTDKWYHSW